MKMKSLYQKYRPQTLSNVVGQPKTVAELQSRIKEDAIPQVLFFSGNTGVGKTTIMRIVAKSILCQNKDKDGNPCNECEYCRDIMDETFSLGAFFFNASNIGIDDMRGIEELAKTSSLMSPKKVIIIDELQELHANKKAQKNLLVLLEHDLPDVYFLLGTMDVDRVDRAIRNRSLHFVLHNVPYDQIARYLLAIMKAEGKSPTPEQMDMLAVIADSSYGSVRAAISYLERCMWSNIWTSAEFVKELLILDQHELYEITRMLLHGDPSLLNVPFNETMFDNLRVMLKEIYKLICGIDSPSKVKTIALKFKNYPRDLIVESLNVMNEKNNFIYITKDIIEFLLIQAIEKNHQFNSRNATNKVQEPKGETKAPEQPLRRRG